MASRPKALVNRIVDAIVLQIQTHANENPHLWHRAPKTIKEYEAEDDVKKARPLILVLAESPVDDGEHLNLDAHRGAASFLIFYIDEDSKSPNRIGHEGAADIRRALAANEQLRMNDTDAPVLQSGSLFSQGYFFGATSPNVSAGTVEVVLRYRADYEWNHETT